MLLTLRKVDEDNNRWSLNGQIFQAYGGLYTALDMGLALGLGTSDLMNLPPNEWTHHKHNNTYTTEV